MFPNWSGFNINSSKVNQPNIEFKNLIKKTFPNKAGCIAQIDKLIGLERSEKVEEYRARWAEMKAEDRQALQYLSMEWLMVFGQPVGKTNQLTGQGIVKVINGNEITYDSFEPAFRENMHLDWQIIADLADTKKVLAISHDQKLRFVLEQKLVLPMSIKETTQEHNDYRAQVAAFNKERMHHVIETCKNDNDVFEEVTKDFVIGSSSENAMKMMFTDSKGQQKERLQDAKKLAKAKVTEQLDEQMRWESAQQQFLNERIDFNKYAD